MPSAEHGYRQMLNNKLQKEGKRTDLNYEYTSSGPNHAIVWIAYVYLAKEQIGQGTGATKGDAAEAAAEAAYENLSRAS